MNLLNALCFLPDGTLDRRDVEIEGGNTVMGTISVSQTTM